MKKLFYILATTATFALVAPSLASAETIVVKHRGMHDGWHHWHFDRGWHHHHGGDRTVIIKRHRHDY